MILKQIENKMKMNCFWLHIFCVFLFIEGVIVQSSNAPSSKQKPYYFAGVVEFAPDNSTTDPSKQLENNLNGILSIIESENAKELDIIVFPEFALNNVQTPIAVPNPKDYIRPCGQAKYSNVIEQLSCSANRGRKYVVINLTMKLNCSDEAVDLEKANILCPDNGFHLYNTAVVFDRNGVVISTYRKFNLFGDAGIRKTGNADLTTFTTDFNVTFGIIICFDIVVSTPAVDLVNRGVKNFIMPTMWYSELPFSTGPQVQQSWAFAHNVNLLAAGASVPSDGYTGSGIYSGHQGVLNAIISNTPITKLIVAYVPNVPDTVIAKTTINKRRSSKHNGFTSNPTIIFSPENLPHLKLKMLDFNEKPKQDGKLCKNNFCCHYDVEVFVHKLPSDSTYYSYAIGVHNGEISFKPYSNVVIYGTICSLVACSNETNCNFDFSKNSGQRLEKYVFKKLHLYGIFPSNRFSKNAPNTLTTDLLPLQSNDVNYVESKEYAATTTANLRKIVLKKDISLRLAHPRSDLITFSIYQRDYSRDKISSNSNQIAITFGCLLFSALVTLQLK